MTMWFTADTHYGHKNIVRGVSSWGNKSGCRDFDTIADMNDAMVDSINACVKRMTSCITLEIWLWGSLRMSLSFDSG